MSSTPPEEQSLLNKLDGVVPAPLAQFDAFPKLPSTYKARSESRGFMTLLIAMMAFTLMLNDIGEFIWGWPDYEFSIDSNKASFLNVNVDLVVNMPCKYLSVDLRDAVGDRLFLSGGLKRDGTTFDIGQATKLKEHAESLSATQAVAQSRKSRGLFSTLFRQNPNSKYKPTYNHQPDGSACRIYGSLQVKKVTANLHITTLGHGYASYEHVEHSQMNLSHIITEFSFGPYFPDITQPLDNSFEATNDNFVAYQYFLHVVPTTYIAPRSRPLQTHQYSVTHYTRVHEDHQGTPGIFFKFDLDPLSITLHQRTTTFIQLIIRCVGVIGGVFVCMGYAIRITTRAVEVVSGADQAQGIVAAEASGAKVGLKGKWGGNHLRARQKSGRMIRQGNGWVLEGGDDQTLVMGGGGSPYASYAGTPISPAFTTSPYFPPPSPMGPGGVVSPIGPPPGPGMHSRGNSIVGLGLSPSTFGPPPTSPRVGAPSPLSPGDAGSQVPSSPAIPSVGIPSSAPGTPLYANGNGFAHHGNGSPVVGGPPARKVSPKKDD